MNTECRRGRSEGKREGGQEGRLRKRYVYLMNLIQIYKGENRIECCVNSKMRVMKGGRKERIG